MDSYLELIKNLTTLLSSFSLLNNLKTLCSLTFNEQRSTNHACP